MKELFGRNLCSKTGGVAFSLNVFIFFAINLIASIFITALKIPVGSDGYLYVSYLISPIAMLLSVLVTLNLGKFKIGEIVKVKCHPKYFLIGLLLIFGLMFSLGWTNSLITEFFKLFGYVPKSSYLPNVSGFKIIPALLVIAVLPAIFEEMFFRGLILQSTQNGAGSIRSVFIVGFCFALYHGSPEQTVYQFICGCAFALLAVRSGSLLPTVIIHFINNAFIIIASATGLIDAAGNFTFSQTAQTVLVILSAISLIAAIVWLILDKTELKRSEKGGVKCFFIFASIGIAILSLIWILNLFGVA